ncbi:hypothetical protein J2T02_004935 [Chitinophaga terrae (ex Kim and Jung 2007)]|nr:hypothetical protein [Chitinophaga terrae (ex Kim and Jung 2007)]
MRARIYDCFRMAYPFGGLFGKRFKEVARQTCIS